MTHRKSGFSLLEALVALAILVLLVTTGVPMLQSIILDASRRAAVNTFLVSVHLARSAAIRRNLPVVICADGAEPCDPSEQWNEGWVVFVNTDADRPPRLDPGEPVLLRHVPSARVRVLPNRDAFHFYRIGLRSTNGTVLFCDPRGDRSARAVIVSYTGRPRLSRLRANGMPLQCE